MDMILGALILGAYFLPTIVALLRNHRSEWAIIAMNALLGWTLLFWLWSLIWSLNGNVREDQSERVVPEWRR